MACVWWIIGAKLMCKKTHLMVQKYGGEFPFNTVGQNSKNNLHMDKDKHIHTCV